VKKYKPNKQTNKTNNHCMIGSDFPVQSVKQGSRCLPGRWDQHCKANGMLNFLPVWQQEPVLLSTILILSVDFQIFAWNFLLLNASNFLLSTFCFNNSCGFKVLVSKVLVSRLVI
jgi:hypothetical protein